ncbi:MAG: acyl-CoA thioesterase [Casimicrobiaceae bacterium]|nr:acyl-CoA thioesterase [Casimicrobiaceae bacterium]MCX8098138.1 acyl-CoA thioesterase [Casimicrobiaceae bacterium]MDW8311676.1 thioesterase family protein [Burkholderiales bacterium]
MNDSRESFLHWLVIPTRWADNDIYGHVNNVVYYAWFDTVINRYLIEAGGLDIHGSPVVGYCVESGCTYRRSFAFPEPVEAGLRVAHLGRSSVRYEVGLFGAGEPTARAIGYFVHVFVDRAANRSVPIPEAIRRALERVRVGTP